MWIPAAVLVTGLFAVIFATERYGLRFGGVVVVPLLGMYVLYDFRALPLFVISTATAFLALVVIERRVVLYGRRLFMTAIIVGALVPVTTFLVAQFVLGEALQLREIAYIGSILPGIAAYNLYRLERDEQVADVVGSLTLVAGLVLLAAFFLVPRAILGGSVSATGLLATAEQMFFGRVGPVLTPPAPVLPRAAVVGLFVVGLGMSELARKRYGVRLAGVIAVPLVAVFALQDLRLLALYLAAVAVAAWFIRLVHRTTFLYGRNLLGGACIVGVIIAAFSIPYLPADVGLRPLIVGLLGGVTAYNGHVLSPGERVKSVAISAGSFVLLFGLADWVAHSLGRAYVYEVTATDAIVGVVLLAMGVMALFEFELLRPDRPITSFANGTESVVPDGGSVEHDDVLSDGGAVDPLAGRRVTRVSDNVRIVSRERGGDE